ncbi:MAG: (2Fe-2S)-binding protein [Pseudomonadota bacterium]
MLEFTLNRRTLSVAADPGTPLLWVLRDTLKLYGTKYGCGRALCGACTVHVDGAPVRACVLPIESVAGRSVTTIEGIGNGELHPLQAAWIDADVPQCGYCQSGQIMSAAALLATNANPGDADIDTAMRGNLCRCGTYDRIRRAIKDASVRLRDDAAAALDETGETGA